MYFLEPRGLQVPLRVAIDNEMIFVFRCEIPGIDVNGTYTTLNDSVLKIYVPRLASGQFARCSLLNTTTNTPYKCNSWVFDRTYYGTTKATEWHFICDKRWMGAVAQSTYMFGVFTGSIILGNLADKIGRKPVFCWSAVLQLLLGVGVAFTPEYFSFLVVRYLYGIVGNAGCCIPAFVLTMELVGPSRRSMCGVAFHAAFAVGIMLLAAWGSFVKDGQLLQVIYGCHATILIGHIWLMDESPRWLWANGKTKESVDIVKKALKMNGCPVILDTAKFVSKGKSESRINNDNVGVLDIFRNANIRKKALNVMLCWFANSIVYYGLSLNTGKLEGNPYVVLFMMGLVELPSYIATVYLMDRLGRRSLISFDMIIGGICCITAANFVVGSVASTAFVFIGKFLISSSFTIVHTYSAELFPTVVRNSAVGLGFMCARISGALTPLMITFLDSFDAKISAVSFAITALISGFLVMFLPETLHKSMPQTIQDSEEFGVGDTCFAAICGKRKDRKDENEEQLQPLK